MEEFEYGVLADFLSENWAKFERFAQEHGIDQARCEDIANELEKQAGRK